MKKDITDLSDIKIMVDTFYNKVNQDELLSLIFNDEARVNWETHLPKMYDFWNSILFGGKNYKGQPFPKHLVLNIGTQHFERWIALFKESVNSLFEGAKADEAKMRGESIAQIFQFKIKSLKPDFK